MRTTPMTPDLYEYVLRHNPLPHPILKKVAEVTAKRPDKGMQISQDQGAFMHMLARVTGAKRAIEVGCFTGYSAIAVATGLGRGGKLITLDIDPDATNLAREFFHEAGLDEVIDLRLGSADKSLAAMEKEFGRDSFDFAFIDADKQNYPTYYEACLRLVRPGGVIIVDNVIWSGKVVDASVQDENTMAIKAFNEMVRRDERVVKSLVHISDGLLLLTKPVW